MYEERAAGGSGRRGVDINGELLGECGELGVDAGLLGDVDGAGIGAAAGEAVGLCVLGE